MFLKKQYMRFLILRSHTRMIQKKKKKKKKEKNSMDIYDYFSAFLTSRPQQIL